MSEKEELGKVNELLAVSLNKAMDYIKDLQAEIDRAKIDNIGLREELELSQKWGNEKTKLNNAIHAKERDCRLELQRLKSSVSNEPVKELLKKVRAELNLLCYDGNLLEKAGNLWGLFFELEKAIFEPVKEKKDIKVNCNCRKVGQYTGHIICDNTCEF